MRTTKKYLNGQSRGGTPGRATDTTRSDGRKKHYENQCVSHWGSYQALEESNAAIKKASQ